MMLNQKINAFVVSHENLIQKYFTLILTLLIVSVTVITTFTLENTIVGFEKGYDELAPKHHGSVSSNTLAIIVNSTLENGFVGYAVRDKDANNNVIYDYFNRYPVFYSAIFNRILALRPKLSSKIYLAKQVMNLIFVASLLVAFLICNKLIKNKLLSLTAVLVAFANPYLLFYKDMVHFDQPAIFGMLLLTYAIALYKIDGLKWPVLISTLIAIGLGRGYASYGVLGLWLVVEAFLIWRTHDLHFKQKVTAILKHLSFSMMVMGVLWGAGLLTYNTIVEARTRNISILSTSIVDSASRRLGFNQQFNTNFEEIINWPSYVQLQIPRIIKWIAPFKWPSPNLLLSLGLLAVVIAVIVIAIRRQPLEKKIVFILLAFSGFVWMTLMKNLAAFHDYTTMNFIGTSIAFYLSLLILLKPSRDAVVYLALMGLMIYSSAIVQVRDLHETIGANISEYTYDFMQIDEVLNSKGNNIYMASEIPYGTFAAEFYMPDQYLSPQSIANYVISSDKNYLPDDLTPDNKMMFLFKSP